ncbi:hypothetical protein L593_12825 [Salinarchaeum sp. Harcht-Bsk1]|nr:hypothetical protein L593_12825 [Salinarchaeum sp. Harcht-Bsk1]
MDSSEQVQVGSSGERRYPLSDGPGSADAGAWTTDRDDDQSTCSIYGNVIRSSTGSTTARPPIGTGTVGAV